MKRFVLVLTIFVSACATRHTPETNLWFSDCYNKKHQESLIARSESLLSDNDIETRRNLRRAYWKLQKDCK